MRILFASDLYALRPAFELYAEALAMGHYDLGILGGDLLDDFWLPEAKAAPLPDPPPSPPRDSHPLISETPKGADDLDGLRSLELEMKRILADAGKPILLVAGNHDLTPWDDFESVRNIHGKRVELGGWSFVGYRWTKVEKSEAEQAADLKELAPLVDRRTVLLTHEPPFGRLDTNGYDGIHWGGRSLARFIVRTRPAYHLFGHVHEAAGIRIRAVNGSYPNSRAFYAIDLDEGKAMAIPAEGSADYGSADYGNPGCGDTGYLADSDDARASAGIAPGSGPADKGRD